MSWPDLCFIISSSNWNENGEVSLAPRGLIVPIIWVRGRSPRAPGSPDVGSSRAPVNTGASEPPDMSPLWKAAPSPAYPDHYSFWVITPRACRLLPRVVLPATALRVRGVTVASAGKLQIRWEQEFQIKYNVLRVRTQGRSVCPCWGPPAILHVLGFLAALLLRYISLSVHLTVLTVQYVFLTIYLPWILQHDKHE